MTVDEWTRFHCIHCAHHLGFAVRSDLRVDFRADPLAIADSRAAGHAALVIAMEYESGVRVEDEFGRGDGLHDQGAGRAGT